MNHKKVERVYREEGLSLRRRMRRKYAAVPRVALPKPTRPGLCYAMDVVHDRLANGRRFKCLTMTIRARKKCRRLKWMFQLVEEPGKPVQNAFIESFNGKFRDECLNEHWFVTLHEAQTVIETWRRE